MNNIVVSGGLTKDAYIGDNVASFTIAFSDFSKTKTSFLKCVVFKGGIKIVEEQGKKGANVCVSGSLEMIPANKEKGFPASFQVIVRELNFFNNRTEASEEIEEKEIENKSIDILTKAQETKPDDDLPF